MISSLSQSALAGIQRGLQQTTNAMSNIATADRGIDVGDLAANVVDLKLGQRQVKASAMALKIEDQLRGTLLDIRV